MSKSHDAYKEVFDSPKSRRIKDMHGGIARAVASNIFHGRVSNEPLVAMPRAPPPENTQPEEFIQTPCKFSPSGWKYVTKSALAQKLVSYPYKKYTHGFRSYAASVAGSSESPRDASVGRLADVPSSPDLKKIGRIVNGENVVGMRDLERLLRNDEIYRSISVGRHHQNNPYSSTYERSYETSLEPKF